MPKPGEGCHPALLGIATLGLKAGVPDKKIQEDIRNAIPIGIRRISNREIADAIRKAKTDRDGGTYTPEQQPEPIVHDGKATLQKLIAQGKISDEADLFELSPIRLWDEPKNDPALFLSTIFQADDLVWIGSQYDKGIPGRTIRSVAAWIDHFRSGGATAPFIIINPLSGKPAPTKSGGISYRGDGNVKSYRHCLIEFDTLGREDQIRFWSAAKLHIRALIDTGGKSIHGWIDIQRQATVTTAEQWGKEIKIRYYEKILKPLTVDAACSNAARLSRLPGHFREEKKKYQRLLWLSPEGKPVCD